VSKGTKIEHDIYRIYLVCGFNVTCDMWYLIFRSQVIIWKPKK